MSDTKKVHAHLNTLTRQQLIALASQRTNIEFRDILSMDKGKLVAKLEGIEGVLKPEQV